MATFSAIWLSKDETVRLGVTETSLPPNIRIIRSSLEEGLAEELGGRIIASSAQQQEGHDVFLMTGRGGTGGDKIYITQAIVAVGNKVYKVIACGIGKDTRVDPDATAFISSFRILTPRQIVDSVPREDVGNSQPALNQPSESLIGLLSRRIGGISALILLVGVIVIVLLRFVTHREPTA